jgi:hypothetical protein
VPRTGLQLEGQLANANIGAWFNDIANVRIHGTTGLVPMEVSLKNARNL